VADPGAEERCGRLRRSLSRGRRKMTARDEYRRALQDLDDPKPFLLESSGLPGPSANIELAQAMADVGTRKQFDQFVSFTPKRAPIGSREEFLAACSPWTRSAYWGGDGCTIFHIARQKSWTKRQLAPDPVEVVLVPGCSHPRILRNGRLTTALGHGQAPMTMR
jgi:hypothetical protein